MEERKLRKKKEKAIDEKNYEQIYAYCKELGDKHTEVEEYEEALTEYKEAEHAAKKLDNKLYIAIANRMIGETLCSMSEFEEALSRQKIHLNFSKKENNQIEEQRALATLGRTYFVKAESFSNENDDKRKFLELSRKYYLKSLNICDRLSQSNNLTQKQLSEMKARLYLNLGLISDSEGDVYSGIEHVTKAINICKHLDLMEDLCRCHKAQGSLYLKHGDSSNAILNYDEALKIADRLENRVLFSCEILLLKADVLIQLLDFTGAKQVLIKAYKLKTPDMKERKEIEKKLKILVTICRTENKLLEINKNDYNSIKCLNETLGDCFVKLKSFKKAIECYRKMLECTEALGISGKDLISAYFSLSLTYKDNGQYDMALEYFEREFEIERDNPAEACKTLLNIIEILEIQKQDLDFIMKKYEQALSLAKKVRDFKIEAAVLRSMIACEKAYNREDLACETQKELDVILCCIPNDDSEIVSNSSDDEIEFEVDLEELSDLNTDSEDNTSGREKHPRRKVTRSFLVRKNEKGETPLHVASAKGNLQLVKSLLKQGHPVNIPDAAGWSPLHEACNHGQVEVAKVLIDAGANIDDRGGPNCDGITPLHDAASCGHLEVIDMLLDNGASPLVRNNQGETALDCLMACKQRVESEEGELDLIKLAHFNSVRFRLEECLSKVGYNSTKSTSKRNIVDSKFHIQTEESRSSQSFSNSIDISRKRGNPALLDDTFNNAAAEYQDAMLALRHRNKKECPSLLSEKHDRPKPSALLNDEEIGDDWLENDLDISNRPTKRRCDQFVGQQRVKTVKSNLTTSDVSLSTLKKNAFTSVKPKWDDAFNDLDFNDLDFAISSGSPITQFNIETCTNTTTGNVERDRPSSQTIVSNPSDKKIRPKYQKSLTSVGFKRFNPSNHSTQQLPQTANSSSCADFIEPLITTPIISKPSSTLTSPNNSIKVRVEGKLFLVPVPVDHSELNIKWLVREASKRYQNLEGVSPVLSLSTAEGAMLDENDPISIAFDKNEIHATAISWNLTPLVDRYKEICVSSNIDVDDYLSMQLDICQANACFQIKDIPAPLPLLTPALKAISCYQNLQRICLCGVLLRDSGFKVLVDAVTKLTQLRCLDISSNSITSEGLSYLILVLSKSESLQNLEELDFSYNPLGQDSIEQLTNLTRFLVRLRVLNLKSVGLASKLSYEALNFNFEFIEYLDLSNNPMGREECAKFLSALDSNKIKFLNMSRTGRSQVFRECLLFLDRGYLDMLETLKLADLDIDDNDVQQLIQSLKKADKISNLDLSCNMRITLGSHEFLSELKNLKELNLSGCDTLAASNKLILPFCSLSLSSKCNESIFKDAPYGLKIN